MHATVGSRKVVEDGGRKSERGKGREAGRCRTARVEEEDVSYPPRKAPTGLRTGIAPTGTSSRRAELWKLRRVMAGVDMLAARRRAGIESAREAIVCVCEMCVAA